MLDQTSPMGLAGRDCDWFTTEYIRPKIISINRILFLAWLVLIAVIFDAHFNCNRAARNTYVRLYNVISHDVINLPKTHYRMARLIYLFQSFNNTYPTNIFLSWKLCLLFMPAAFFQVHIKLDFFMDANTMNPDQTAPFGAVWSGSILFAA